MKNRLLVIAFTLFIIIAQSCSQKKCDCSLVYKDESSKLFFLRETKAPYTGLCNEVFGNGETRLLKEFKDGKKVSSKAFYDTGEKKFEEIFDQAGMFTSGKTFSKDGKVMTEEVFNASDKNMSRIGYHTNGQISFQETIQFDTITFKTYQEDGKPIIDKQAIVNMNWENYLMPGEALNNNDTCMIDYKDPYFKGYLIYYNEYFKNGNPKFKFLFKEGAMKNLGYKLGWLNYEQRIALRGGVPILNILELGSNTIKSGSKAFFEEDGKIYFESIEPRQCPSIGFLHSAQTIIGIHYNKNGNIFAVSCLEGYMELYHFSEGNWSKHPFDGGPDVPLAVVTNLDQLCMQ
jgi:hypothetical protein